MSKVSMPRPRYIAFKLSGEAVPRRALGNAIGDQARKEGWAEGTSPQLTRFVWPHAIVRVDHAHAPAARKMLPRVGFAATGDAKRAISIETLGTSGTLKALTTRLGILEKRDEGSMKSVPAGSKAISAPLGKKAGLTRPTKAG